MAQLTDVVSLNRAKQWLRIGTADNFQDVQLAMAITAASAWLDDKTGPVVQRTVDGATVGRFADTATAEDTQFGLAALQFTAWLLRSYMLRVANVDGYDVPAVSGTDPPVEAIRLLLGDEWFDPDVGSNDSYLGSVTLGVWASP